MANPEHLAILKQGVKAWAEWRAENAEVIPNLIEADLSGADLSEAKLIGADLSRAKLSGADLIGANLIEAKLFGADLIEAKLSGADLSRAKLSWAKLSRADLIWADLIEANLSGANLSEANLSRATLIGTDLTGATLTGCSIYGISAWDVKVENTQQSGLIVTTGNQPKITVDNIKVAQFIYQLLENSGFRDIIDTMTGKAVLILGRFGERKAILDSIADELRKRDYLPIMFDFDRPIDRNFRETVQTLAGLSKFVIADLTDPKSTPLESLAIFYNYRIPFLPLIQEGQDPFSMFNDFKLEVGYIPPVQFKDVDEIKTIFDERILAPAEAKHKLIREAKAK